MEQSDDSNDFPAQPSALASESELKRELIAFLNAWQEKRDLRPSELVKLLKWAADTVGPK